MRYSISLEEGILRMLSKRGPSTTNFIGLSLIFDDGIEPQVTWSEVQRGLGRLLIEKKIDYTKEGLWATIE
jgi:hypothetical protein